MANNSEKPNALWLSTKGGLNEYGLKGMGAVFMNNDRITSLVRESVQNSLDAKRNDAELVSMEFAYLKVDENSFPGRLRFLEILNCCKNFVKSKVEKDFLESGRVALGSMGTHPQLGILRISDHGTIGLTGMEDYNENGRFRGLVTRMGMGNDDGSRGGNFGVGKQALFLASKIHTVFFSSIDNTGYAGHMGVAKLSSFLDKKLGDGADGKGLRADSTIYYCNSSFDAEEQTGNPVICGQFGLAKRDKDDFGTDVFIMGFDPNKDELKFSNSILTVLLTEFVVSIEEGKLAVTLPDGFRVDKNNIGKAYEKFVKNKPGKKDLREVTSYVDLLSREWKSSPMLPVAPSIPSFPAGAIQYKFIKSDEDNFCRITREKGMFVHTVKNVCGNSGCIGIAVIRDKSLNATFKNMENESHLEFKVTDQRFPDEDQFARAKARLKALEDFLRKCANDEVGSKIEKQMAARLPDELEELMNICAGQVAVNEVKGKNGPTGKIAGTRVKRRRHKPRSAVQATSAGIDRGDTTTDTEEPGIQNTGKKSNHGKHANPGGDKNVNPASPEANGYAMRALEIAPVFYASGAAESGRYKVSFTVPRSRAKVCLCFSATTETDSQERLDVKSVSATDVNGVAIPCSIDLGGTAIAFDNVEKGAVINAEIEFDVSYYCYSQVRYYEKKNN